jgi:hypothetical protein
MALLFRRGLLYSMLLCLAFLIIGMISTLPIKSTLMKSGINFQLISLSEQLLKEVRYSAPCSDTEKILSNLDMQSLIEGLGDDDAKKTFWINIYNAWYQLLAIREKLNRPEIFTRQVISIAGRNFSLDDIEHGILRRYRWKYSMGYFPSFFPGKLIKQLAVSTIDYRIHFALNCGAKSCPPILFYSYDNIQEQLNMATRSFLRSETEIDEFKKEVRVSKIMDWFRGDFGGTKGIRRIIGDIFEKDYKGYTLEFKSYDWDMKLRNFQ